MKKKVISLAAGVVVLAVLIGVLVVLSNKSKAEGEPEPSPTAETFILTAGEASEIESITLKNADEEIKLIKDADGVWSLADYPDIPIVQSAVTGIASAISNTSSSTIVTENIDNLSEFGLDTGRIEIIGNYNDGSSATIYIGEQTVAQDFYYVMIPDDNNIYLLQTYNAWNYIKTYDDLVDKTFDTIDPMNIRTLYIDTGKILLEGKYVEPDLDDTSIKIAASSLILSSPYKGKSVYLENFNTMVVEPLAAIELGSLVNIESGTDEEYGFNDPQFEIEMSGILLDEEGNESGQYTYGLIVGKNTDDTGTYAYAKKHGSPCVFTVAMEDITPIINVNMFKLLDRFIDIMYINYVDKILIETHENTYVAEINPYKEYKDEEDTEGIDAIDPFVDGISVDADAFRDFYQIIGGMMIDAYLEEEFVAADEPALKITYQLNNGEADRITNYYDYNENFYAIGFNGENKCQFVINKNYVDKMLVDIAEVKAGKKAD